MMTDDELTAIRAREAAATRGPWESGLSDMVTMSPGEGFSNRLIADCRVESWHHHNMDFQANAAFIAHARADIPALLADRDAVLAENARLRAGIEDLRVDHISYWTACDDYGRPSPPESGKYCDCGADDHNAKVDALLKGET